MRPRPTKSGPYLETFGPYGLSLGHDECYEECPLESFSDHKLTVYYVFA